MKAKQPDHQPQDVGLAGLLVISLFSMFIGIILGVFIAL
jgi:hypothetical protein